MRLLYLPESLYPKGACPGVIMFISSKEESIIPPTSLFSYPPNPAPGECLVPVPAVLSAHADVGSHHSQHVLLSPSSAASVGASAAR